MRRMLLLIGIVLMAVPAYIQAQPKRPAYPRMFFVAYDGSPVYDSASYLSTILGDLSLGDTVRVLGASGKFFQILYHGRRAYVLGANVTAEPPQAGGRGAKKPGSAVRDTARAPAVQGKPPRLSRSGADSTRADTTHALDSSKMHRGDALPRRPANGADAGAGGAAVPAGSAPGAAADQTGAGQQCKAITRSGKRCSRRTSDASGYCWQHRK